jgi:hypothetical protein
MSAGKRFRATTDRTWRPFPSVKPFFAAWPYSTAQEAFPGAGADFDALLLAVQSAELDDGRERS